MAGNRCDALVIFGATGDLAKLETFPALVGLVERGVLDFPVVGVAKMGWGLEQFRDYAVASLKLNKMDPTTPAAQKMVSLLRYVDGDLTDDATYRAMSDAAGPGKELLFYFEVPAFLFGRIAEGIATAGRAPGARVMVEKPFGSDLASSIKLNETMHQYFAEDAIFRVDDWLAFEPAPGARRRPTGCCPTGTPGTTQRAEPGQARQPRSMKRPKAGPHEATATPAACRNTPTNLAA
jgi:glucose-6-phosphate 1-dehydrogenase